MKENSCIYHSPKSQAAELFIHFTFIHLFNKYLLSNSSQGVSDLGIQRIIMMLDLCSERERQRSKSMNKESLR